jgi:predicted flap endonuclease-1-like 5' DNA nuclease
MNPLRSLFLLLAGLVSGAGTAVYLLQREPVARPARLDMSPALAGELAAPVAELEQWKSRAQSVQAQLQEMEKSLVDLRDELASVQDWQAKAPSLVRLGQSLALLPHYKAAAADAAIAAMRFPTVSADCQKLAIVSGIGEIYEQRLYTAGVGSYWEVAHLADEEFQRMLRLTEWQLTAVDLDGIRSRARQLAEQTGTVGLLWEGETPDDLGMIPGIGKAIEKRLYAAGIRTYAALAGQAADELNRILGPLVVKPDVQRWIAEARRLSSKPEAKG